MVAIIRIVLVFGSVALADVLPQPAELMDWAEDRFISCIFCMNYDDRNRLNIYGCSVTSLPSCYGNVCYMRQHKNPMYYLYTSGCLNMTRKQMHRMSTRLKSLKPERGAKGNETQLCEVTSKTNACICTNRAQCNNVTTAEPFTEYTNHFLHFVHFDEMAHMRHFIPNDPELEEIAIFRDSRRPISRNTASTSTLSSIANVLMTMMLNLYIIF